MRIRIRPRSREGVSAPHSIRRMALLQALVLLLAGCPSYMTYHSTRTAPPGQVELVLGGGQALVGQSLFTGVQTELTCVGRIGITSMMDIGFRLRSDLVAGGEVKVRFLDTERLHMALAPGIYFSLLAPAFNGLSRVAERVFGLERLASAFAYEAHLPLLFGIPFQEHIFIFGPKLAFTNWNIQALVDADTPLSGMSVGMTLLVPGVVFALDWEAGMGMRVQPEINIHFDLYGLLFVQAGIAIYL